MKIFENMSYKIGYRQQKQQKMKIPKTKKQPKKKQQMKNNLPYCNICDARAIVSSSL